MSWWVCLFRSLLRFKSGLNRMCDNCLACLTVAYLLNIAVWSIEVFIALITHIRIRRAAFCAIYHHCWTLGSRIGTRLTIWQIVSVLALFTRERSLASQTVVQTNYYLAIFASVSIFAFSTNTWCLAATFTFLRAHHIALITFVTWFASFAFVLSSY
jgi:hypothetical protein